MPWKTRELLFKLSGGTCTLCKREIKMFKAHCDFYSAPKVAHVDHIVPLSKGGLNNIFNLQMLREPCNCSKGAR